jgi:tetratricopeptide (TPR) repeat protein
MTPNLNSVSRSRESADQFLFSKTEFIHPAEKPVAESFPGQERLSAAFPEATVGKAFTDFAANHLSAAFAFSAMVIKIDDFPEAADGDDSMEVLVDVAAVIQHCCKSDRGLWGRLDRDLFGCFFPEKNVSSCMAVAEKIRKTLSSPGENSVSIGIAGYPTINYTRAQIIENARKALDHAAFFGPGSMIPFDSVSLNISGDNRYARGDVPGAIDEFKKALLIDPSNVNVHNSLGVCFGVMEDLDKALEAFETAAWLDAEEFMAQYNVGIVRLIRAEKEKALSCFLKADRIGAGVFEIALQTGKLYLEMNDPEKGRPYLEKAVRLNTDAGSAFRYLGDCLSALNDTEGAISAYKSSVKLNPNDAAALSALGCMFDLHGENLEISTTFCLQSVEISPENGLYRQRLGDLYVKQNRFQEALKEFETARELGHDSAELIEETRNRLSANAS